MFALSMNGLGVGESPPRARGAGSGRRGGGGGKGPPFLAGISGSPPSCVLALCCGPGKSKSKEQTDVGASSNSQGTNTQRAVSNRRGTLLLERNIQVVLVVKSLPAKAGDLREWV